MQLILGTANLGSIYSLNQKNKIKKNFFLILLNLRLKIKSKHLILHQNIKMLKKF